LKPQRVVTLQEPRRVSQAGASAQQGIQRRDARVDSEPSSYLASVADRPARKSRREPRALELARDVSQSDGHTTESVQPEHRKSRKHRRRSRKRRSQMSEMEDGELDDNSVVSDRRARLRRRSGRGDGNAEAEVIEQDDEEHDDDEDADEAAGQEEDEEGEEEERRRDEVDVEDIEEGDEEEDE